MNDIIGKDWAELVVLLFDFKKSWIEELINNLEKSVPDLEKWKEDSNVCYKELYDKIKEKIKVIKDSNKHYNTVVELNDSYKNEDSIKEIMWLMTNNLQNHQVELNDLKKYKKQLLKTWDREWHKLYDIKSTITNLKYLLTIDVSDEEKIIDALKPVYDGLVNGLTPPQKYVLSTIVKWVGPIWKINYKHAISVLKRKNILLSGEKKWEYIINTKKYPLLDKHLKYICGVYKTEWIKIDKFYFIH